MTEKELRALRGCRMRAWNPYWVSGHLTRCGTGTEGSDMKMGSWIRVGLVVAATFALAWLPQAALAQHGGGHGGGGGGGFHGGGGGGGFHGGGGFSGGHP